jgi:type IV pilus assembly protein PilC
VKKGVGLGKSLEKYGALFPLIETDMITIGEETGKLDEVLLYLAEFYEGNVSQMTKNLSQTIEPILLLIVGAVVAVIVLAVITPIYQISEAIV